VITAADERRHGATDEELWGESWYFDFAAEDESVGGYVRLGLYPNKRVAWWWATVVRPDQPTILVRDHEVALPKREALEVRSEGLWGEITCETAHEHWSVGMEAFGVALDDPADAYRGERGMRVPLGIDLEWEAAAPLYEYPEPMTRYEQPCMVHGDVLVGDERLTIDAVGERDHSWGVRDWWAIPWCWTSGRLNDGTAFHASKPLIEGVSFEPGFVVRTGGELSPIDGFSVETTHDDEGIALTATMRVGPLSMAVTPLAHAPLALASADGRVSRFPRSLCRIKTDDGRAGVGWTEWNQPPGWQAP
jgi:hypothetical protein